MSLLDTIRVTVRIAVMVGACSAAALLSIAPAALAQTGPVQPGSAQPAAARAASPATAGAKQVKPAPRKVAAAEDGQAEAASAKKDPAQAVRQVDGGIKLLQADKAEQAVQTLSVAIASGTLAPALMARALYHRGAGYRKTGKPAQAISDLTSALYVKSGLSEADRQDALKQRAEAYREAGLPDQTGDDGRPAGSASSRRASAAGAVTASTGAVAASGAAPVTTSSLAPTTAPAAAPSTGGLFATLFDGLNRSQAQAARPAPAAVAAPAVSQPQPTTSGWSSGSTTVRPARTTAAAAAATPPQAASVSGGAPVKVAAAGGSAAAVAASAPIAASGGGFHARIALVRNEAEAQPIMQRLKTQYAAALAGKPATQSAAQFGGMGTFTQVRVGPYASKAEADALCVRLKGSGLDCVAVDR